MLCTCNKSSMTDSYEIRSCLCFVQTLMSKSNLFLGNSSSSVNSPVISLSVKSCGSRRRRRRRRAATATTASTTVDINLSEPSRAIAVNDTPPADSNGIIMSVFNLTSPGAMPVLLHIIPNDPVHVNVYVSRNETPTTTNYEWFLTSSNNGSNNYSLYIPAELTTHVNQLFVGVQSLTGQYLYFLTLLHKGVFLDCIEVLCVLDSLD